MKNNYWTIIAHIGPNFKYALSVEHMPKRQLGGIRADEHQTELSSAGERSIHSAQYQAGPCT